MLVWANIGKYMTSFPLIWIPTLAALRLLSPSFSDRYVVNFASAFSAKRCVRWAGTRETDFLALCYFLLQF